MSTPDINGLGIRLVTYKFTNFIVHLHEGGLVQETKSGNKTYSWADLESFCYTVETIRFGLNRSNFTLIVKDGQKLKLDNYFRSTVAAFNQFLEILPQVALKPLLERSLAKINSGQEVQFGPIRLTASGIRHKNKELPWADVTELRSGRSGCYSLQTYNQTKRKQQEFWRGMNLPNYSIFETLVCMLAPNVKLLINRN